jgi:hypothetical protein
MILNGSTKMSFFTSKPTKAFLLIIKRGKTTKELKILHLKI